MEHIIHWIPIFLWMVLTFNYGNHIETHHKHEMVHYVDALNQQRKYKWELSWQYNMRKFPRI